MTTENKIRTKIRIEVREHLCWCDSCFCRCLHEAILLETGEAIKIRIGDLLGNTYQVTWSTLPPTMSVSIYDKKLKPKW